MAVTLEQAKAWIRVEHNIEDALIGRMIDATSAEVERYAPDAPDAVKEHAIERMIAYSYDSRAEVHSRAHSNIMRLSGAKPMLAPYRTRRARKIED